MPFVGALTGFHVLLAQQLVSGRFTENTRNKKSNCKGLGGGKENAEQYVR